MKQSKILAAALFIILSICTLTAKEYKKQFNVEPGQKLYLDFETGMDIYITGWDKEVVDIELSVTGRDADLVEVEFEQTSSGVEVNTDYEYDHNSNRCKGHIRVNVPSRFNIDFITMGGDVTIQDVEGEIEGKTMGGEFEFSGLKGELNCETMGGEIELTDSDVDGRLKTMGGKVKLENVVGNIDASTMGGSIIQKNVKSRSGKGSPQNISTMGGAIEITDALNGAYAKTMGGDIKVEHVKDFLECETMGGAIRVEKLDGRIKAKTMGGDIEVNMIGNPAEGDRDVFLKSMGGDVELIVPEGLSMDIDVEIEWTRGHRQPEIITDFGVESKSTDNKGHRRREVYITGEKIVNGGKNKITIRTVNGDVRILKK